MISNERDKLKSLINLSNEIAEVKDLDVLMERILASAREFTNSDAGSIYIKDGDNLLFNYSQNDTLSSRLTPGEKLIYTTFSVPINNRSMAGYVAFTGETLNIEDAYNLPESLSFKFDKSFDKSTNYETHSMLTVPLKTSAGNIIGVLQLINSKDPNGKITPYEKDLEPYVVYFANNAAGTLERALLMRTTLLRMISMAELRDPKETGNHVNRVAGYSVEIYETWAAAKNIPKKEIDHNRDVLRMAAMLHDVGKVAISDLILKKPGKLDENEFEIMKQHTIVGAKLFNNSTSKFDESARDVALNHHERYNGRGYPGHIDPYTLKPVEGKTDENGNPIPKKEDEIPLFGRIVSLADTYDALSSSRCYKEAWDEEQVLKVIREESGRQFDPEIVQAFFVCLPTLRSLAERYS